MFKRKNFAKIALIVVVLAIFAVLASGCTNNSVAKLDKLDDWKDYVAPDADKIIAEAGKSEDSTESEASSESNTESATESTTESEVSTESESDSVSESESDSVSESESDTETEAVAGGTTDTGSTDSGDKKYDPDKVITFEEEYGFIDTILLWIGKFINIITKVMPGHSYILALFVFAIVIELLMLPFSISQQRNSRKQAMLRPKEMAIRKKYAGRTDQATQQKIQQEIQELYQKEQFNPMSGCMPLLLQLPIIMMLYSIVINPLKYVVGIGGNFSGFAVQYMTDKIGTDVASNGTISFIAKAKELGIEAFEGVKTFFNDAATGEAVYLKIKNVIDQTENMNFNVFGLNMGYNPGFSPIEPKYWWLLAVPVLTFLVYFFSAKITRKFTYQPPQSETQGAQQPGCSAKSMDWMMPLMSVYITFIVPAAVGIYWIFKSIVSTIKQIIMSKAMPMPEFSEEDYKAAEREYMGKNPKKPKEKSPNAGKVRSLHHIDDDDYDEYGNYTPASIEMEDDEVIDTTATEPDALPENSMTEGTTLKDESDRHNK